HRALGDPALGDFQVQLDAVGMVRRQQRIVEADLLDEAAVAGIAAVGDDDVVVRAFLGAAAGQTNTKCHLKNSFPDCHPRASGGPLLLPTTAGPETFRAAFHRGTRRRPSRAASWASCPSPFSSSCPPSGGAS